MLRIAAEPARQHESLRTGPGIEIESGIEVVRASGRGNGSAKGQPRIDAHSDILFASQGIEATPFDPGDIPLTQEE
jgi:hypothetical protein